VQIPAGNWYVNCDINVKNGGTLIFKGGTIVVQGGISIASGGCLVVNTNVSSCPTAASIVNSGTVEATTAVPPTGDAIVYVRGSGCSNYCFDDAGDFIAPQTFMYSASSALGMNVNNQAGAVTLWTAPGAGAVNGGTQRTLLEQQCFDPAANNGSGAVIEECMRSRFSTLVYWSEYAAPKTKPDNMTGQGSLSLAGVFFTPTAYFDLGGGGSYQATFAQVWADSLNVNGGAFLGLLPDQKTAIETHIGEVDLIR
jgi:hypothetical protein